MVRRRGDGSASLVAAFGSGGVVLRGWAGCCFLAWLLCAPVLAAQASAEDGFDANAMRLPAGPSAFVAQRSAEVAPHLALTAGYVLGWHQRPLVLVREDGRSEPAVAGQLEGNTLVSVGLWGRAQLGFVVPLVLLQPGTGLSPLREGGASTSRLEMLVLRDPRVALDALLVPRRAGSDGPGLLLSLAASLPLGRRRDLGGGRFGLEPTLVADWAQGPWRFGLQGSFRWFASSRRVGRARLGDEVVVGLAARHRWRASRLSAGLELNGRFQLAAQPEGAPLQHGYEALLSGRWMPWRGGDLALSAALGAGIGGVGTAAFRALVGVQYELPLPGGPAERLSRPLPASTSRRAPREPR